MQNVDAGMGFLRQNYGDLIKLARENIKNPTSKFSSGNGLSSIKNRLGSAHSMILPRLIPAPHLTRKKLIPPKISTPPVTHVPDAKDGISWTELYAEQKKLNNELGKSLNESKQEIVCLKLKMKATEANAAKEKAESESKIAGLKREVMRLNKILKTSDANVIQQREDLNQLQTKLDASNEDHQAEKVRLQAELDRLSTLIPPAIPERQHDLLVAKTAKRRKELQKCSDCDYTTLKAYNMKVHRQEGCKQAQVIKSAKCEVCQARFTYNGLRCHLNQYTKTSSTAKNGHQAFTPAQHRRMLEKIKRSSMSHSS